MTWFRTFAASDIELWGQRGQTTSGCRFDLPTDRFPSFRAKCELNNVACNVKAACHSKILNFSFHAHSKETLHCHHHLIWHRVKSPSAQNVIGIHLIAWDDASCVWTRLAQWSNESYSNVILQNKRFMESDLQSLCAKGIIQIAPFWLVIFFLNNFSGADSSELPAEWLQFSGVNIRKPGRFWLTS